MTQSTNPTRSLLIGVVVSAVLLVAIAATVTFRQNQTAVLPTATFVPDVPGVTPIDPPHAVIDFTMPSASGQPLTFSSLQGKAALVFFGYTHCQDTCPATLGEWVFIKKNLGDAAAQVNFVFISVDAPRDTPDVMRKFLNGFDPTFIGLSGDAAVLSKISADFGLYYKLNTDEGANYSVDHTSQIYLFNAQGLMTDIFSNEANPDVIVKTMRKVIADSKA